MAEDRLAGIADILPPAAPPDETGAMSWLLLLLLLPLCGWAWRWWRRQGRLDWQLWRLGRTVSRQRMDTRAAADRLAAVLRGRALDQALREQLDQARFAASPVGPEAFLGLLQQINRTGVRHGD